MKTLCLFLSVFASASIVFAAQPDKEAIVYGMSHANIIISAVQGPSFSSGGGTTSTLEIRGIFAGKNTLTGQKQISVHWSTKAELGSEKCLLWFLAPETNQQAFVETVGSKYPFIEATEENIGFLKSMLKKGNPGAGTPTSHPVGALEATPVTVQISVEDSHFVYRLDNKPIKSDEILYSLKQRRDNFGIKQDSRILITEDVPMSALLQMYRVIKASGLDGGITFFLITPRVEGRNERGEITVNQGALHELNLWPFPNPPEISVPKIEPYIPSIQTGGPPIPTKK